MNRDNLAESVKTLVDIEAIKRLHLEYVYSLNSQQWDEMLACFTDDAVIDLWDHGLCRGKAEIEAQFKGELANKVKPQDGHLIAQPLIDVNGDTAVGRWMMYIFFPESDRRFVKGKYDAEYTRVDNEWKFSRLIFTCPWPKTA